MRMRRAARPAETISAEAAAALVRSGMWLEYGGIYSQPDLFDTALGARIHGLHDIGIRSALTMRPRAPIEADPEGRHVNLVSLHFGGYDRKLHDAGRCHYLPVNLGEIPDYYRRFIDPVDIVIVKCCPADAEGFFNFSGANLYYRAFIERAR